MFTRIGESRDLSRAVRMQFKEEMPVPASKPERAILKLTWLRAKKIQPLSEHLCVFARLLEMLITDLDKQGIIGGLFSFLDQIRALDFERMRLPEMAPKVVPHLLRINRPVRGFFGGVEIPFQTLHHRLLLVSYGECNRQCLRVVCCLRK